MGTLFAWLAERLTGKIAVPLLGVLLLTNLVSGVGLGITRHTLSNVRDDLATEKRVHLADIEIWKAGAVIALLRDRQHAKDVQDKQDEITKEHENALQEKLAVARAAAASIVRTYAQAHYNGGKGSNLPQAADTPGGSLEAPAGAFLSAVDIEACAVAHTVAAGWQDWWNQEYPVMLEGSRDDSVAADRTVIPISPMGAKRGIDLGFVDPGAENLGGRTYTTQPGSQRSALGAVDVDRPAVAAVRGHVPSPQSNAGLGNQPVDLLAAVEPGAITLLPAPIEASSTDRENNEDDRKSGNDGPPDHKNFLP